jgi:hypothetical protein
MHGRIISVILKLAALHWKSDQAILTQTLMGNYNLKEDRTYLRTAEISDRDVKRRHCNAFLHLICNILLDLRNKPLKAKLPPSTRRGCARGEQIR